MGRTDNPMVSRIELPVIDLSLFDLGDPWRDQVAAQIDSASSQFGFFYVVGHGIDTAVVDPLLEASGRFFAAAEAVRMQLAPDGVPATSAIAMRGQILLPEVPGFREPVLDYMGSLTGLGHKLMAMIARGLLLEDSYFVDRCTGSPSTAFRIDDYPPVAVARAVTETWCGAAHMERGLLTILKQDGMGGLGFKYQDCWLDVPDISNSFVCSVGDTLARLTNGRYMSAARRISNSTKSHRLSMQFRFDPSQGAVVEPIAAIGPAIPRAPFSDDMPNVLSELGHRHLA
jgi:isopenicillin N synthase-like dioxygenase